MRLTVIRRAYRDPVVQDWTGALLVGSIVGCSSALAIGVVVWAARWLGWSP